MVVGLNAFNKHVAVLNNVNKILFPFDLFETRSVGMELIGFIASLNVDPMIFLVAETFVS